MLSSTSSPKDPVDSEVTRSAKSTDPVDAIGAEEAAYREIELAHFRRGWPSHSSLHKDWLEGQASYQLLREEYLKCLEYWPGYGPKREMVEKLLETTADWVKTVRPAGRLYEAHLARIKDGSVDPAACQLCHGGVLARKHPRYNHGTDESRQKLDISPSAPAPVDTHVCPPASDDDERKRKVIKLASSSTAPVG